jgi:hypothetical protein
MTVTGLKHDRAAEVTGKFRGGTGRANEPRAPFAPCHSRAAKYSLAGITIPGARPALPRSPNPNSFPPVFRPLRHRKSSLRPAAFYAGEEALSTFRLMPASAAGNAVSHFMKQILLLLLVAFTMSGCSRNGSDSKKGSADVAGVWVSPREYQNPYFGIRVAVPDEWELKKGTTQEINDQAVDFLAGDEKNLRSVMKSAVEKTQTIFWAYRYPVGTPGKSNPNVSMLIESVARLPGIKSPEDYLSVLEQTLKMSNKTFNFLPAANVIDMGGMRLAMRESDLPMGELVIHQRFYATMKDRQILLIGVTTIADDDEGEVAHVLQSIKKM